jgi:hypothetical protein
MAADPTHGRAVAFPDESRTAGDGTRLLFERHGRSVYAYCLRQLRDPADAEDAVQATFLNAFRSMQRGVLPDLEQAWLYTIAGRVCANRRRANMRRRRVETPTDLYDVEAEAYVQPAAERTSQKPLQRFPSSSGRHCCCARPRASPIERSARRFSSHRELSSSCSFGRVARSRSGSRRR